MLFTHRSLRFKTSKNIKHLSSPRFLRLLSLQVICWVYYFYWKQSCSVVHFPKLRICCQAKSLVQYLRLPVTVTAILAFRRLPLPLKDWNLFCNSVHFIYKYLIFICLPKICSEWIVTWIYYEAYLSFCISLVLKSSVDSKDSTKQILEAKLKCMEKMKCKFRL